MHRTLIAMNGKLGTVEGLQGLGLAAPFFSVDSLPLRPRPPEALSFSLPPPLVQAGLWRTSIYEVRTSKADEDWHEFCCKSVTNADGAGGQKVYLVVIYRWHSLCHHNLQRHPLLPHSLSLCYMLHVKQQGLGRHRIAAPLMSIAVHSQK